MNATNRCCRPASPVVLLVRHPAIEALELLFQQAQIVSLGVQCPLGQCSYLPCVDISVPKGALLRSAIIA
jgi:hypothetical protein